jgi:FkbM family methyltransferase
MIVMPMIKRIRDLTMRRPMMQRLVRSGSRAGLLPASIHGRLPVYGSHPVTSPAGTRFVYVANPYDLLARKVVWGNMTTWETTSLRAWSDLCRGASLVLDVGAYSGIYSLIACVDGASTAIAVEPNPSLLPSLENNIRANGLTNRITVVSKGVSDTPGFARLHIPTDTTAATFMGAGEGPRVALTTIDAIVEHRQVDLIKLDVEGWEPAAIRGARKTLLRDHPPLLMECLTKESFDTLDALVASLGYTSVEHMSAGGARHVTNWVYERGHWNFLWR